MNEKFTGCDNLRLWLENQGFRIYARREDDNACNWYACKKTSLSARKCECDERPIQIVVWPFLFYFTPSFEVEIRGMAHGRWYRLQCYDIREAELRENLPKIEQSLISAWNALTP